VPLLTKVSNWAEPAASNCFAFLPMMLEISVVTPPAIAALKGFFC